MYNLFYKTMSKIFISASLVAASLFAFTSVNDVKAKENAKELPSNVINMVEESVKRNDSKFILQLVMNENPIASVDACHVNCYAQCHTNCYAQCHTNCYANCN